MADKYTPDWASLRHHITPQWLRDDKFGIYTHWGIYSVPACGPNGTWYAHNIYRGGSQAEYHEKTFGPVTEFGYKDFIPQFTAEKFDADEWAEIFKASGARFAGPVAEHHDGFSMWDSKVNEWNAAKMGPKRNVVGELEKAFRAQNMRFMVALHHAEQWWFYPHWRSDCDVSNPEYAGLYGPMHNLDGLDPEIVERWREWMAQDRPTKDFLDFWRAKIDELVEGYQPDLIWFDFGINFVLESYKKQFLADYYNKEAEWGRELAVTYKGHDIVPGTGLIDYELGRMDKLTYYDWITDTSVDDQGAWSYVADAGFKKVSTLVHNLIDNVSKNGYLLLNVGPRADGSIPDGAKKCLAGMGDWLKINGEAIFETMPWVSYGEGPTKMEKAGMFSEQHEVEYTPDDIRFTCRDNLLYATCLGWPEKKATIKSMKKLYPGEIDSVRLLGVDKDLDWSMTQKGLEIDVPEQKPCEDAFVFKITRKSPF
jgi:alpha-L-fucosidase